MKALHPVQKPFQPVRQGNGAGGVGHEEGPHNKEHDPQHHKDRVADALFGDMQDPPLHQIVVSRGKEQIQNTGENQDEQHRLEAPDQSPDAHPGDPDAHRQHQRHQGVGEHAVGAEQCDDVEHHQQNLGTGIQLVGHSIAGEKLTQGNVFQHGAPPFRNARSRRSRSRTV